MSIKLAIAGDESPRRRAPLPTLATVALIQLLLMLCLATLAILS